MIRKRISPNFTSTTSSPSIAEIKNDPGFGNKVIGNVDRLLNKDGSFNVKREGMPFLHSINPYHTLISMPWWQFNMVVIVAYVIVNTIFAALYYITGVEHLAGILGQTEIDKFWDAFFFSGQTLTTVGYGRISPVGFIGSSVAAVESLVGLLGFALATGLLYGRFSRPVARVMFSENMIVAPYKDGLGLMLRLANKRNNQLVEIEGQVLLSRIETENGVSSRKSYTLPLERKLVSLLSLSWTIVHPIDEKSPLHGVNKEMLEKSDAEFIIMIKAFDDTFSQTVHTRTSYKHDEIIWGAKFRPMFKGEEGHTALLMNKINDFEKVKIPHQLA